LKRIATVSLESITPVSLGGYDTYLRRQIGNIHLTEPFRLTSVKGIWHWWLRAYLAGAAWDESLNEMEGANESQSILGSPQAASLFGFRILSQNSEPLDSERKVSENLRVRLLLRVWGQQHLNKAQIGRLRALFRYLKAEFEVYSRKSSTPTILALGSLITGLKLGGLGKFSRRAFGSFKVHVESKHPEMKPIMENLEEAETAREPTTVANSLKEIIDATKAAASTYLKNCKIGGVRDDSQIPAIPSFAKGFHTIHLFEAPISMSVIDVLNEVSKSVTRAASRLRRPTISAALTGGVRNHMTWNRVRKPLAWVLGLPRKTEPTDRRRISTGYVEMWVDKKPVSRRASPLIFKLLQKRLLAATLFISSDWPNLKWVNRWVKGQRPSCEFDIIIDRKKGNVMIDDRRYSLKGLMTDVERYLTDYFEAWKPLKVI